MQVRFQVFIKRTQVKQPEAGPTLNLELAKKMAAFPAGSTFRIKNIMNKHLRGFMDKVLDDETVALGDGIKSLMLKAQRKKQGKAKL